MSDMNVIERAATSHSGSRRSDMASRMSKKVVCKILGGLKYGCLQVRDGQELQSFGSAGGNYTFTAQVTVLNPKFYQRILMNGTIGAGESYMQGEWTTPDLVSVIRLLSRNMHVAQKMDSGWMFMSRFFLRIAHRANANRRFKAKENIAAHYDLGNDFFKLFLDPTMMYSAAIFRDATDSLEQASLAKIRHIGQRLSLGPDDHLLEIGTGWGAMAIYAAKWFGCRVTSVTLSKQQYAYAHAWVIKENLQDLVEIRLQDYRDIRGQFDKIVSIEMIEAVGYEFYSEFFSRCSALLKANGCMLLQAITIADQRYEAEKDNVDFIQRYIFPGGCLPSVNCISQHVVADTDMQIVGLDDITLHYAETLKYWRAAFEKSLDRVRQQGFDDVFVRMWRFYLCYCEGGFRERVISTSQILLAKPECQQLPAISLGEKA